MQIPSAQEIIAESTIIKPNLVLNLSNLTVSPALLTVLERGFTFAPYSTKPSKNTVDANIKAVNQFIQRIRSVLHDRYTFREWPKLVSTSTSKLLQSAHNSEAPDPQTSLPNQRMFQHAMSRVMKQVGDTSHNGTIGSLHNLLTLKWAQDKFTQLARNATYNYFDNLTAFERREYSKLIQAVRNGQVLVRKADKSQQLVLLNRHMYDETLERMLADKSQYESLEFSTKYLTAAKIIRTLKKFQTCFESKVQLTTLIEQCRKPKDRHFYGLPKTHKDRQKWTDGMPPMRPICPDVNTETAATAKLIAYYLGPIHSQQPAYLKNSYQLKALLTQTNTDFTNAVILVADVDSLYPSIPIQQGLDRTRNAIQACYHKMDCYDNCILDLLRIQMENNCFLFNHKYYKQLHGIPMGKAWAPAVASIYLSEWEASIFKKLHVQPLLYKRYIDDIICIVKSSDDAQLILNAMQVEDSNIRIGEYTIAQAVHFLDLQIDCAGSTVRTTVYTKPTHLRVLLDFQSAHNKSIKANLVLAQFIRIYRLNTDARVAGSQMRMFSILMRKFRNLPSRTARNIWARFLNWLENSMTTSKPAQKKSFQRSSTLWLSNNIYLKPFQKSLQHFATQLTEEEVQRLGLLQVRTKAPRNIGRVLYVP